MLYFFNMLKKMQLRCKSKMQKEKGGNFFYLCYYARNVLMPSSKYLTHLCQFKVVQTHTNSITLANLTRVQ